MCSRDIGLDAHVVRHSGLSDSIEATRSLRIEKGAFL